ncbi:hypothetical protein F4818DRAFT_399294 [Hypoxylon cercidicola]|nr:hypothetical protein F4818DRAFT_399294 [Hypoxylon cercidicola]
MSTTAAYLNGFMDSCNNFIRSSDKTNTAENSGRRNAIDQEGTYNECHQENEGNKTGQQGNHHMSKVVGYYNRIIQLLAHNTGEVRGNNCRIGQRGKYNEISADGDGREIIQYGDNDKYPKDGENGSKEYRFSGGGLNNCLAWIREIKEHWPWKEDGDRLW